MFTDIAGIFLRSLDNQGLCGLLDGERRTVPQSSHPARTSDFRLSKLVDCDPNLRAWDAKAQRLHVAGSACSWVNSGLAPNRWDRDGAYINLIS